MPRNGGSRLADTTKLPRDKHPPIGATEAAKLFSDLRNAHTVVLAVSGGPDSTALLWLAARWRKRLKNGPGLIAVTVNHGLRKEAAREARDVGKLASSLGVSHVTLRWRGKKPVAGLPAAAREARYLLLAKAARDAGAVHVITAHTSDDQAETFMMRLSRGSGLAGLAAMARQSVRGEMLLMRPLIDVPKARLIATLRKAKVTFADDPSNRDTAFTRPRWRTLLPELAREGVDARNLTRLAARLARANAALDAVADRADRALVQRDGSHQSIDACGFLTLPDEIRLRVLHRAVDRAGHEGPAELGKVEVLLEQLVVAIEANGKQTFKRTLSGAVIALRQSVIAVEPAPFRRVRA